MSEELIKRLRTEYTMCSIVDGLEDVAAVLRDAIAALSRPAPAVQVPDGWKLVPVEPTKAMRDAGRWEEYGEESSHHYPVDDIAIDSVWEAMLAAAPSAPAAPTIANQEGK